MLNNFTVGADPEIFIKEKKSGKAASAHGLIKGDKKNPLKTPKGAVQVDGLALEFNIDPVVASDFNSFNTNIVQTVKDLRAMVSPDFSFNPSPVQDFDAEYIEAQPDEAKELGCDPDFCAYTMEENPRPDGTRNFRTGAGHIHVGWGADIPVDNKEHFEICANFIKFMDATVGMFMTFIDREPRRRELYGKAGAFRPKPYGVEYRTPSNAWIISKERREVVFFLVQKAISYAGQGRSVGAVTGTSDQEIQKIIDTGDVHQAESLLRMYFKYSKHETTLNKLKASFKNEK